MQEFGQITLILVLSVVGPILGSALGVLKKPKDSFVFNMLAFAAGVMLSISFLELIPTAIAMSGIVIASIGVAVGAGFMFILESAVPYITEQFKLIDSNVKQGKISKKTPVYLIGGMFFHNFPEGMAIAIGFFSNFSLSLTVALAMALHHIPEGISTAAPYYALTKKKWKAFLVSSVTALPTLIGFAFAFYLYQLIPFWAIGLISGVTAGVMIYISGDELIPASCQRITNQKTIFSLVIGVLFVLVLKMFL